MFKQVDKKIITILCVKSLLISGPMYITDLNKRLLLNIDCTLYMFDKFILMWGIGHRGEMNLKRQSDFKFNWTPNSPPLLAWEGICNVAQVGMINSIEF